MSEQLTSGQAVEHLRRTSELNNAFSDAQAFIGITAIHGIEPFLIVVESARKINDELEVHGLPRKPIILPETPGYRAQLNRVLPDEYSDTPERKKVLGDIYFSTQLGEILATTKFDLSGYQPHLESVAANQPKTQEDLWRFLGNGFTATSFTDGTEIAINGQDRLIELNAGANVTAAREGEKTGHFIFPVTFDGLLRMTQNHNDGEIFDYRDGLLKDCLAIAERLKGRYATTFIPFLHTLLEEPQLTDELYQDAIYFPPLKEMQDPPQDIHFDFEGKNITVDNKSDLSQSEVYGFNPEKGAVYVNISGGGMGLAEAYRSVYTIHAQGYAIFAPAWIIGDWEKANFDTSFAIPAGPRILYAKDPEDKPVIKGILMRSGKGITDRAEMAEIAMILNTYNKGDNPEIWGNDQAIVKRNLGRGYSARADLINLIESGNHAEHIRRFKTSQRRAHGVAQTISGPEYVAKKIIEAEIAARKS